MRDFGELLAVEIWILELEGAGEHFAVAVQFDEECFVETLIAALEQFAAEGFAFGFGQRFGEFGEGIIGNGFAGKEPVNLRELPRIGVVGVSEFF